jgi:hypothetical protein
MSHPIALYRTQSHRIALKKSGSEMSRVKSEERRAERWKKLLVSMETCYEKSAYRLFK